MSGDLKIKTTQLRRDHILDEAIKVFNIDGYRGTTIHAIAHAAGISDGTIYNVFENKEDILLAVLERLLRVSIPDSASAPQMPSDVQSNLLLRAMVSSRWQDLSPEILAMMRVVLSEALVNRSFAKRYYETILAPTLSAPELVFEDLKVRGEIADTDIPMAVRTVLASFLGFALLKMLGDPVVTERTADVPKYLAEILTNGFIPRGSDDAI